MTHQDTPYKVTKAPSKPTSRTRLLRTCNFSNGPYTATERKVCADENRELPIMLKVEGSKGVYRLRPGTFDYVWVAS